MILLRVSYRVRAHQIGPFEGIFQQEILPLVREHRLKLAGIFKSKVGTVGEFIELWEFEDLQEFEELWPRLIGDPRLQDIFQRTGPMVEEETFHLFEPAAGSSGFAEGFS
ncbi:MAG TPA: NIPSNAP family protein [Acidobacteriota bacterium]|nr:NIPSNAP family protein [Acidobacteriota bacterium]